MLRYLFAGHASVPPVAADLIPSLSENDVCVVCRRVMPVVGAPLGSTLARKNSILESAVNGKNGAGVLLTSGLVRLKSRLSTSIWLLICASERFCAAVFQTTWTTTGIRVTP